MSIPQNLLCGTVLFGATACVTVFMQIPPLWFFLSFAAIVYFCWLMYRLPLRQLRSLLDEGDGGIGGIMRARLEGHFQGREVRFLSGAGHPGWNSEQLEISLETVRPIQFEIEKKSLGAATFTAAVNLATGGRLTIPDIQAGNSETLRRLSFVPGTSPLLLRWLHQTEVQNRIEPLFVDHGVDSLRMKEGYLTAACSFVISKKYKVENVRGILQDMTYLVRSLENSPS